MIAERATRKSYWFITFAFLFLPPQVIAETICLPAADKKTWVCKEGEAPSITPTETLVIVSQEHISRPISSNAQARAKTYVSPYVRPSITTLPRYQSVDYTSARNKALYDKPANKPAVSQPQTNAVKASERQAVEPTIKRETSPPESSAQASSDSAKTSDNPDFKPQNTADKHAQTYSIRFQGSARQSKLESLQKKLAQQGITSQISSQPLGELDWWILHHGSFKNRHSAQAVLTQLQLKSDLRLVVIPHP